ncbi:MAG: hypothetical protein ACYDDF_01605 [Thermoplasmatota archaeon]
MEPLTGPRWYALVVVGMALSIPVDLWLPVPDGMAGAGWRFLNAFVPMLFFSGTFSLFFLDASLRRSTRKRALIANSVWGKAAFFFVMTTWTAAGTIDAQWIPVVAYGLGAILLLGYRFRSMSRTDRIWGVGICTVGLMVFNPLTGLLPLAFFALLASEIVAFFGAIEAGPHQPSAVRRAAPYVAGLSVGAVALAVSLGAVFVAPHRTGIVASGTLFAALIPLAIVGLIGFPAVFLFLSN